MSNKLLTTDAEYHDLIRDARVMHFTLQKRWFDMIAAGIKKEEYRKFDTYWGRRFHDGNWTSFLIGDQVFTHKPVDYFVFHNGGYCSVTLPTLVVEATGIIIGYPAFPEWGAPDEWCFILGLENVVFNNSKTIKKL